MSSTTSLGERIGTWRLPDDQSFALLHRVFEISTLGIAVVDLASRVIAVNPALAAIVGYPADELIGLPVARLIHPDDWPSEAADLNHVAHGEASSVPSERRLVRKDGTAAAVRIQASAVHDQDHAATALVLMVEDLTSSREAETRRAESESILAALFESTIDAVFVADADTGVIIDANKAAADLLRHPVEQLKGRPVWSLLPEDEDEQHKELFFQITRNPGTRFSDVAVERPDGSELVVEARSGGILTLGRRRVATVFFRDLSAVRETEDALRRAERRYRDMIETTSEGFMQLSPEGVIVEANDAFCYMVGLSRGEVLGRHPTEFVHPSYLEALEAQMAARAKTRHRSYELVLTGVDGIERFTRIQSSSVFDEHGRFVGSNALLSDLTELKRRKAALAKSEARNRAIVETAVDAIVTIDTRGKVLSVNPAGEKMLGSAAEELVGQDITLIIPGPDAAGHQGHVERYMKTRHKHVIGIGREVLVRRKDSSTFPARLAVSEIELPDFHVFVGLIHD
ncbi:MAG TPA: PAS domain S-box protein, partial [Azospirillaceae bacterium]|nr:PAS domain S-box protein [Azospirillaceae bacterium]